MDVDQLLNCCKLYYMKDVHTTPFTFCFQGVVTQFDLHVVYMEMLKL